MTIGYTALVCAPPFPVVVLSFFLLGLGMALYLGMTNAFIVNLMNGTVLLGLCHGIYGVSPALDLQRFNFLMAFSLVVLYLP